MPRFVPGLFYEPGLNGLSGQKNILKIPLIRLIPVPYLCANENE